MSALYILFKCFCFGGLYSSRVALRTAVSIVEEVVNGALGCRQGKDRGKEECERRPGPRYFTRHCLNFVYRHYAPAATQNALHLSRAFLVESRNLAVGNLSLLPGNLNRLFKFSLICIILANVTNINCSFS